MSEGGFVSGATAVHEEPSDDIVDPYDEKRAAFRAQVREHMRVLGPSRLLECLAGAHRYPTIANTPTEKLFVALAARDGWDVALHVVADVIGEVRDERQAASRA